MDINDLRSAMTVLSFGLFAGIVWWAYSAHRKGAFDEASRIPMDDDLPVAETRATVADAEK